jgi:hypothetical protein
LSSEWIRQLNLVGLFVIVHVLGRPNQEREKREMKIYIFNYGTPTNEAISETRA